MDIRIERKKSSRGKTLLLVGVLLAFPSAFAAQYLWDLSRTESHIDSDKLAFGTVARGDYVVAVRGTGVLVPSDFQWLTTEVESTVVRVVHKAGNSVEKGDVLVELGNAALVRQLAEEQWELEALIEELVAIQAEKDTEVLEKEDEILEFKLRYEEASLVFDAYDGLLGSGAVPELDYKRSRLNRDQSRVRWKTSESVLAKMKENNAAQVKAKAARYEQALRRVESLRKQIDELTVRAPVDGSILEMPVQAGQSLPIGSNIARMARGKTLIAELQVSEIQISDVAVGNPVEIDTRRNLIEGTVVRIDPAVVDGNVQVDVELSGELPPEARPALSVDGEITVTEIEDTLYVSRPVFAQSRTSGTLYRLSPDERFVERVNVDIGYGSVNQIQILDGLAAGDRIVISDTTRLQDHERTRIN